MSDDLYHDELLELARHPLHAGTMEQPDVELHGSNPSCGDDVTIHLKLSANHQLIEDILWTGQGCVMSQVAMSVVADRLIGQPWSAVKELTLEEILSDLRLTTLSPGRIKCVMLGASALAKAVPG